MMIKVLTLLILMSATTHAQKFYTVASVRDGDSLRVVGIKKAIRVLGINAPEISGPFGKHADPYGPEATLALRALLEGQKVRLGFEPKSRLDRCNDRLLYYLFTEQGINVSLEMVLRGHAIYERRFYTR